MSSCFKNRFSYRKIKNYSEKYKKIFEGMLRLVQFIADEDEMVWQFSSEFILLSLFTR